MSLWGRSSTSERKLRLLARSTSERSASVETLYEGNDLGGAGAFLTPALRTGRRRQHDYFARHFGPDLVLIPVDDEEQGLAHMNAARIRARGAIFCSDRAVR